jgi:tripartite-type tricarboxylate transporter receptor subunit TctC
LKDASFVEKLNATGASPWITSPADMKSFVNTEIDKWVKVARESGAKAD